MFFKRPDPVMVSAADALPGRSTALAVADAHLVLGTPMTPPFPDHLDTLVVGMGCFWGAERFFWQLEGVYTTAVGYAGGFTPNPTYEETCTGRTGHTEAVLVVFDPSVVSIDTLLGVFWENHDPTTANRQGNDVGTQYRSAIYTNSPEQEAAVAASVAQYAARLSKAGFGEISTEVAPAGEFFYAEDYHQQYLQKNPNGYCNHGFCQISYAD
jgi:peptide-methionine (S)-S-oxide reductase